MADELGGTPVQNATEALIAFREALEAASDALDGLGGGDGEGGGGVGGGGSGQRGKGAGRPPSMSDFNLLGMVRGHPAGAAALAAGALAAPTVAAGLTSEERGGDFGAGAMANVNQRLAGALPFGLGETTGLSAGVRQFNATVEGTLQDFSNISRFVRPEDVPQEAREFVMQWHREMAGHQEEWRQRVRVDVEKSFNESPPAVGSWLTSEDVRKATATPPPTSLLGAALNLFR